LILGSPQTVSSATVPTYTAPVQQQADTIQEMSKETVVSLIEKYSDHFNVPTQLSKNIAFCESSYNPSIYGDSGRAYSVYQFHKPTFDLFAKEYGKEMDYANVEDHIELANWAFSKDYYYHWTCYKKVKSTTLTI